MWFVSAALAQQPFLPEPTELGGGTVLLGYAEVDDADLDGVDDFVQRDWEIVVWSGRPLVPELVPGAYSTATLGDFDGDGVNDLIAMDGVHSGPGWPLVAPQPTWITGHVADMDGDGDPDVVPGYAAHWHENVGGFTFLDDPQLGVPYSAGCRPADVDGDGVVDLFCSEPDGLTLSWYENDGTGLTFTQHVAWTDPTAYGLLHTPPVDVDADGDLDVVFVRQARVGNTVVASLWLLPGEPADPERFGAPVLLEDPSSPAAPTVGVFDGAAWLASGGTVLRLADGVLDAPIATPGAYRVAWMDWDVDGVRDGSCRGAAGRRSSSTGSSPAP